MTRDENIVEPINRAITESISAFSKEIVQEFKKQLDYAEMPFGDLKIQYDTMGVTTAFFNGKEIMKWTSPKIEVNEDRTSFTYKWTIYRVKEQP